MNRRCLWILGVVLFAAGVAVQIAVRRDPSAGPSVRVEPVRESRAQSSPEPSDSGPKEEDGAPSTATASTADNPPTALPSTEPSGRLEAGASEQLAESLDELARAESLPDDWASILEQVDRGTPEAVTRLREILRIHPRRDVAQQVIRSLERLGGSESVRALYGIGTEREELRSAAAVRLSRLRGRECAPALLEIIADSAAPDELAAAALRSLGHTGLRRAVERIRAIAVDDERSAPVRAAAVEALGRIADPDGLDALISLLRSPDRAVRRQAIRSVGRVRDPRAIAALEDVVEKESSEQERQLAADGLARLRGLPVLRR